jgi:hypothetical protein
LPDGERLTAEDSRLDQQAAYTGRVHLIEVAKGLDQPLAFTYRYLNPTWRW